MANISLQMTLIDADTGEVLGEKDFAVNFGAQSQNVLGWISNGIMWVQQILLPRAELAVLEAQEKALADRRFALEHPEEYAAQQAALQAQANEAPPEP